MNRGLLRKAWLETWTLTLLCAVGLMLIEVAVAYAQLMLQGEMSAIISKFAPLEKLLRTLVGADSALRQLGPESFRAIAWAHPLALVLLLTHAVTFCTRVPAGEVDRSTIDVLLGLPVSRWQLQLTESLVWVLSGAVVVLFAVGGNRLGNALAHGPRVELWRLTALAANLYCLYLAVGGLAWLASSLSDRRGRAVSVVVAFVLLSFVLNYLAPFWRVAEQLSFLSLLHYYIPLEVLRDGLFPLRDLSVLGGLAATLWTAAGLIFARRDLATV
jgi:ABC-2 type transport system permease protein